jgi:formate dehydrogenase subunit beta
MAECKLKDVENKIRKTAKKLLEEKKVNMVVGYEEGPLPMTTSPTFITIPEQVDRLVWNPFCSHNLAFFIHRLLKQHRTSQIRKKPEDRTPFKVAVVAKGCVSRGLAIHLQERQYDRDEIYVIGTPCPGMLDPRKIKKQIGDVEILKASTDGNSLTVETRDGEKKFVISENLFPSCECCIMPNPVISDEILGPEQAPRENPDEFALVEEHGNKGQEERWNYFENEMKKCIRCYACRNVCPLCYCETCFIDQSFPKWAGTTDDITDTEVFHLMRIFHAAGRCTDCGACEQVCPMGVDLRRYTKKLEKEALDLYEQRAGMDPDQAAPLAMFKPDDQQEFITEPE